jgi:methylmalonyl-CoA mutase
MSTSVEAWRDLARHASKGREPEALAVTLAEQVSIDPLCTTRPPGAVTAGRQGAWSARQRISPAASAAVQALRERGVVPVHAAASPVDVSALASLSGEWIVEVGSNVEDVRAALPASATVTLVVDPIGAWARAGGTMTSLAHIWDAVAVVVQQGARLGGASSWVADSGAEMPTRIAVAVLSLVEGLRALEARGAPLRTVETEVEISLVGDVVLDLAAVRAIRRLADRVLRACGVESGPEVHASFPLSALSAVDTTTNLLRLSAAGFAGAAGGADLITLPPHDAGVGEPSFAARRISANLHLLLAREAMLDRVVDPAAGAFAIEQATDALEKAAWREIQAFESAGGLEGVLRDGTLRARVAEQAARRDDAVRRRRTLRIGVSQFADPSSVDTAESTPAIDTSAVGALLEPIAPFDIVRVDEPWEALRTRANGRGVLLIEIGPVAHHKARSDFAKDLFAAGGFSVLSTGAVSDPDAASVAFATQRAKVACVCGNDSDYERWIPTLAPQLRAAGAKSVIVAGRWPADPERWRAAGVSSVVHLGMDFVEALSQVLEDDA